MKKSDMPARHCTSPGIFSAIVAGFLLVTLAARADADLTICNQTKQPTGIALAMKTETLWKSEGWWTVEPGRCKTLLTGRLTMHDYYLHALHYNVGGLWEGEESFCVGRGSFTIEGRFDCEARGYETARFLKVDTKGKSDWQHTLVDHLETTPPTKEKE